ncbi:MAG: hypothetical protein SCALA702_18620 [Melioribacteraceae bacterium]|nr:MAG: hypothetical protein SCALA702_18620 [Melioribacteraceae bacterium]
MKNLKELNSSEVKLNTNDVPEELPNQKTLFELFVEKSDIWEFLVDEQGNVVYTNSACEMITGYECCEFRNEKNLFSKIIFDNDKRKTVEVAHEYKVNTLTIEYRVQTKTSNLVWVQHKSRAVYDHNNEYRGRKVCVSVIDEFKDREKKLVEAQNRLKLTHSIFYELVSEQSIENVVRSALYQTNTMFPELRITYATINESGLMQVKYSQNIDDRLDAEGEVFDASLLKMDRGKFYKIARPYISSNIEEDNLLHSYRKHFRRLQLGAVLVMPLQYSKIINGVICFDSREAREWNQHEIKTLSNIADFLSLSLKLASIMDKQKRAERKYREVSSRMLNLMDTLIGGIIFEDVNSRIVHVNKSFCKLFLMDECFKKLPNSASANLFNDISPLFEETDKFIEFVSNVVTERKTVLKKVFKLKNDHIFEMDYIPVFLGNEYTGRLWHFRDVSDEVKSKEELERNTLLLRRKTEDLSNLNQKLLVSEEELKKTNAEKDKFFSILAHDLRHPFSPILGFSEILIEEAETLTSDEVMEYASIIYNSSKNLHKLVENLLQWSRVQSGRISITPELFNLYDIVETCKTVYLVSARKKNIIFNISVPQNINVYADQNSIDTVIRNLISNSIKFTPANGEISIKAELNNGQVLVSVSDTGVGIKKADIDKLFRIDAQFSTPGTEKEKGSGLGLILVKEFLELNNSTLNITSTPGSGTVFEFNLPVDNKSTL